MFRITFVALGLGIALSGCGQQRAALDPALASGVTSSNGGGVRQTGNTNSQNIGAYGTTTGGSSAVGRAY